MISRMAAWEQRKLGELCTFDKGRGYSKADIRESGTPLVLYGRLYTHYESVIRGPPATLLMFTKKWSE